MIFWLKNGKDYQVSKNQARQKEVWHKKRRLYLSKSTWGEQPDKDIPNFICICVYLSKSTWGEQSVKDIPNFTCICVYVCNYLWVSYLLHKVKTIQTWNLAHILQLTLSTRGFFFRKKSPWQPLASMNCCVKWIFCRSPRLPCISFFFGTGQGNY